MRHIKDIEDDEIRIISGPSEGGGKRPQPFYLRWWFWLVILLTIAIVFLVLKIMLKRQVEQPGIDNQVETETVVTESEPVEPVTIQNQPSDVLLRDTTVNDVPLTIYTPVNAVPELMIGYPSPNDPTLMLAFQAADIRADNGKIVGAFVLKGEPLAWGLSKKGYCAIIDGKMQIGVADNSPLFEETTEKGGYFFRQYPLVNNGVMVENNPKNKAARRALCELDGQIVVVTSLTRESFHDFAQALADLGVRNAIYLIGGDAYGFCKCASGEQTLWDNIRLKSKYVNFIVWRSIPNED